MMCWKSPVTYWILLRHEAADQVWERVGIELALKSLIYLQLLVERTRQHCA